MGAKPQPQDRTNGGSAALLLRLRFPGVVPPPRQRCDATGNGPPRAVVWAVGRPVRVLPHPDGGTLGEPLHPGGARGLPIAHRGAVATTAAAVGEQHCPCGGCIQRIVGAMPCWIPHAGSFDKIGALPLWAATRCCCWRTICC